MWDTMQWVSAGDGTLKLDHITYTDNTGELSQCKFQGFHRGVTEDSSLLGCDTV